MIHDLAVFVAGVIAGVGLGGIVAYAAWVSAALDREEP